MGGRKSLYAPAMSKNFWNRSNKKRLTQAFSAALITSLSGYLINQLPAIPDFPYKNQIIFGAVVGITFIATAILFWQNNPSDEETATIEQPQQKARSHNEQEFLEWVKQEQIGRALSNLHTQQPINLGKKLQPEQVSPLSTVSSKTFGRSVPSLPENSTILEIFNRNDITGKLLILGEPGSGKTITLLELAQSLVQQAEADVNDSIPVLFNLSFWHDPQQTIQEWIVEQLSSYGVSKPLGKKWVNDCRLLPLLDGLDEVKPELQVSCVQAINQWLQEDYRLRLVVCCRKEAYEKVVRGQWQDKTEPEEDQDAGEPEDETENSREEIRLHLNGAILVQPLTNDQIQDYLIAIHQFELWQTIQQDSKLLELVRTPLFLSIVGFISTHQILSIQAWKSLTSTETRIQYLFDAYWETAMARELVNPSQGIKSHSYAKQSLPSKKQTKLWLIFLAKQLQKEAQTEFLIEEMQPSMLSITSQKNYRLNIGLISGLVFGLSSGLNFGLGVAFVGGRLIGDSTFALRSGLNFGLGMAFVGALIGGVGAGQIKIEPVEVLKFKWTNFWTNLEKPIVIGGLSSSVSWLISAVIFGWSVRIIGVVSAGLLISGVMSGLNNESIKSKILPNQGIKQSAKNCLIFGLIGGLISWLSVGLIFGWIFGEVFEWVFGLIGGLSGALNWGLKLGGFACIQHLILRLLLYQNNYIPWNYARFLDYCTERLLLQRIGGRYRFMHKLLQDHFAAMPLERK